MEKSPSSKWQKLREDVLAKARDLTSGLTASDLPVRLLPIAEALHARTVFQPLLVEGATTLTKGGFEILIDVPTDEAHGYQARFGSREDGGRTLSPRQRFTLAHELAHTLFFKWMGDTTKPKSRTSTTRWSELRRLEQECNQVAGYLLIPDHLLASAIKTHDLDLLDPISILAAADSFGVSISCLVIRLQALMGKQSHGHGIALLKTDSTPPTSSYALDIIAKQVLPTNHNEPDITALLTDFPQPEAFCATTHRTIHVPCKFGGRPAFQRVSLAAARAGDNQLLLTMELSGSPELRQ